MDRPVGKPEQKPCASQSPGAPAPGVMPGRDHVSGAVIFSLSILAAFVVVRIVMHVIYPYPLDVGEGTDIDAAWRVANGRSIYNIVTEPPYFFTIYNPVLFYLSGLVLWLAGPVTAAARMVSVAFYAGAAVVIYLFIRRETSSAKAAVIAALFFVVERHVMSRAGYLVTDWPGIFFSLLGLYLWRAEGGRRYWAVVSFALAFFSKQTSLIAAAAAFSALFLEGKRGGSIKMFAVFLAFVAAGLTLCGLLFGRPYFINTLRYASIAPLEIHRSFRHIAVTLALYIVPMAAWPVLAVKSIKDRRLLLVALYGFFGLLMAFMSGKVGASRSYLFDLAAALSLVVGLLWVKVEALSRAGKISFAVAAVITVQVFLAAVGANYRFGIYGDKTNSDFLADTAIHEAFQTTDGMIFLRAPGFTIGSRAEGASDDFYKMTQMIEAGALTEEVFLKPVREKKFAMVIMPVDEGPWILFSPAIQDAITEHYKIESEVYGQLFLVPRKDGDVEDTESF